MDDSANGRYAVEEPKLFDPAAPVVPHVDRWRWWFAAALLMQFAALFVNYTTNSAFRHDLDENAKLIKQLQERIIVKDLANLRKGTP
jgi:hypothetical protein